MSVIGGSGAPEISVIVPTHNRLEILPEVLAALERQEDAPLFEILVVDDGSGGGPAGASPRNGPSSGWRR